MLALSDRCVKLSTSSHVEQHNEVGMEVSAKPSLAPDARLR